jgi:hypothetical protein
MENLEFIAVAENYNNNLDYKFLIKIEGPLEMNDPEVVNQTNEYLNMNIDCVPYCDSDYKIIHKVCDRLNHVAKTKNKYPEFTNWASNDWEGDQNLVSDEFFYDISTFSDSGDAILKVLYETTFDPTLDRAYGDTFVLCLYNVITFNVGINANKLREKRYDPYTYNGTRKLKYSSSGGGKYRKKTSCFRKKKLNRRRKKYSLKSRRVYKYKTTNSSTRRRKEKSHTRRK